MAFLTFHGFRDLKCMPKKLTLSVQKSHASKVSTVSTNFGPKLGSIRLYLT